MRNDGACGARNAGLQRILCVSNVDNQTVCYERNDACTVTQPPNPVDPTDPDPVDPTDPDPVDPDPDPADPDDGDPENPNENPDQNTDGEKLPNTSLMDKNSYLILYGFVLILYGLAIRILMKRIRH